MKYNYRPTQMLSVILFGYLLINSNIYGSYKTAANPIENTAKTVNNTAPAPSAPKINSVQLKFKIDKDINLNLNDFNIIFTIPARTEVNEWVSAISNLPIYSFVTLNLGTKSITVPANAIQFRISDNNNTKSAPINIPTSNTTYTINKKSTHMGSITGKISYYYTVTPQN